MKQIITTIAALLAIFAVTSCNALGKIAIKAVANEEDLEGVKPADTVRIEKAITINGEFSKIVFNGGYDICFKQGEPKVEFAGRKVYCDSAIIKVENGTLDISSRQDRFARGKYIITLPTLMTVHVNGAADIYAENFQQSDNVEFSSSGASDIKLKSSSFGDMKITTAGASDVVLTALTTKNVFINVSGAGNAKAERISSDTINIDIQGAGDFVASGRCKDFICNISGAGDINIDKLDVANKKANEQKSE